MSPPAANSLPTEPLDRLIFIVVGHLKELLISPGGSASLASLACALIVAFLFLSFKAKRLLSPRLILRALFPRRIWASDSAKADFAFLIFNTFVPGLLLAWSVLSYGIVAETTGGALTSLFGERAPSTLPGPLQAGLVTLAMFLAYDLAYFTDHSLSHKIPFLWAFHKVHHTAEVLTPITNFRVHPVDSVVFGNITALFVGFANGAGSFLLGVETQPYAVSGTNIVLVVFIFLLIHLQHTHLWIPFTGVWGRLIVSPAHHQLHHSSDPADFDRNFGSCLAIWDSLFGTLNMPTKERKRLVFGVAPHDPAAHGVTGGLVTPFVEAAQSLVPARPLRPASVD